MFCPGIKVTLGIFDLLGRETAMLLDSPIGASLHEITLDANDSFSGICFYKPMTGQYQEAKKCGGVKIESLNYSANAQCAACRSAIG